MLLQVHLPPGAAASDVKLAPPSTGPFSTWLSRFNLAESPSLSPPLEEISPCLDTDAPCDWLSRACAGDPHAQTIMGMLHESGRGVERRSLGQAAEWFRKAADQGHPQACISLGCLYRDGRGVAQSHEAAFEMFWKAAAKGDAFAMHELGVFYGTGRGVPANQAEAEFWLSRSEMHMMLADQSDSVGGAGRHDLHLASTHGRGWEDTEASDSSSVPSDDLSELSDNMSTVSDGSIDFDKGRDRDNSMLGWIKEAGT